MAPNVRHKLQVDLAQESIALKETGLPTQVTITDDYWVWNSDIKESTDFVSADNITTNLIACARLLRASTTSANGEINPNNDQYWAERKEPSSPMEISGSTDQNDEMDLYWDEANYDLDEAAKYWLA